MVDVLNSSRSYSHSCRSHSSCFPEPGSIVIRITKVTRALPWFGLTPLLISRMSGTPLPESKKSVPTMFRSIGSSYPGFIWQLRPGSLNPDFALAVVVFLMPQSHGPTYSSHSFTPLMSTDVIERFCRGVLI